MRKTATLLAALFLSTTALAQVKDYREIKTPPLRNFSMPQPKRIQLGNGMVIFLQEDHELPLVRGRATIRGGARDVPASKAGMASIYGQSWRTGGTTKQSGDELDQFLESRAAFVETGADNDSSNVSLNVLKQDLDTVFPIWLDLLRNPAFRQEKIDLAKTQANTAISRRNDEPGGILSRESTRLGYGPNSPYARQSEYATIASITRQDLLDFHKRTVHPNNIIVAFIGDFDSVAMERRLRQAFESWPRGPQITKPDPAISAAKPGVYFVSKEDVTQANIAMVHAGTERNNPDYPALQVMNEVFSGGFSGRLMQALRSQRGLTYGVGGSVGAPWDYPGLFRLQMATKSETTLEAIDALRGEVRRLVNDPVTEAELSLAKESILNAYVFTMDTREKALQQRVMLEFYGFPPDYFEKYPSLIEKVTAADVQRVARKYVQPDNLAVLVVGNQAKFEKPLSTLGTVTPIDITIPPADGGTGSGSTGTGTPRPTGSNAEGMALVKKVQEWAGGEAALNGVSAMRVASTRNMVTPQGPMTAETVTVVRYPDSLRNELTLPMGKVTQVITPQGAFVITPMGTQDLPTSQRDDALNDIKSDVISILRNVNNPKYTFSANGGELTINADGPTVRWVVDPATGRILRTVRTTQRGETTTEYADWKKFGPLNMATSATMTTGGQPSGDMKVSNVEINPTIDANAFNKP
ncbi:MAG TPA: pitrilysin family protein [Thermoanaerobaculia bacterium]|nr:pitrilysin family protein [Thermoanaerobaculia bacterium]